MSTISDWNTPLSLIYINTKCVCCLQYVWARGDLLRPLLCVPKYVAQNPHLCSL